MRSGDQAGGAPEAAHVLPALGCSSTCLCLAFSDELLISEAVTPQELLCLWQLGADELPRPDPCTRRSWVPTAEPVFPSLLCLTSRQLKTFSPLGHDPHFWKLVHLPVFCKALAALLGARQSRDVWIHPGILALGVGLPALLQESSHPLGEGRGSQGTLQLCVLAHSPGQDGLYPARLARLLLMGSSLANAQGAPRHAPSLCSPAH